VGTSNWQNISYCVGLLRRIKPSSVLDIGAGFGRWGVLAREFLDVWEGREARGLWKTRIEGIEVFAGCLTPVHDYVYDRVHVGDAVELLPQLGAYDVVYLGDVVEHQDKARGVQLLELARQHASRAAIVTIPIGEGWDQGMGPDGNPHHPHRSVWDVSDFDRYPDARREAFSDFQGRLYLVVEIPGGAVATRLPPDWSASPAASACSGATQDGAADEREAVLDAGLLARIDDCFTSLGLLDNPENHVDAAGALLWQTSAARRIDAALAEIGRSGAPAGAELREMIDALYRYFVAEESARWRADGRQLLPPALERTLEAAAGALSMLAAPQGPVVGRDDAGGAR
jgi:hypothetical protein